MASVPFNNLITFSRGSNATLTGSNGLIQWAPNNLLTFSEQFDNAAWTKSNVTVTANNAAAPDGTTTAELVTPTAADCNIRQSFTPAGAVQYTFSVWLRSATGSDISTSIRAWRDSPFQSAGNATITVTPTWQRFTLTFTALDATSHFVVVGAGSTLSTGENLFIWGAQLELGSAATTYNPTTVKNLLGFSEAFDNAAWNKSNASIVTGAQANPVNGAFNAQKLMEDTANTSHRTFQTVTLAAAPYTFSFYAKPAGRDWIWINVSGTAHTAYVNIATGAIGATVGSPIITMTPLSGGWYRVAMTYQNATAGASNQQIWMASNSTTTIYTGDGNSGVYIYGAQLSDSASLDPYVPTPAAAPSSTAYYGPRFDYDPVTLSPKGLLVEEARTNLLTYSQQFSNAAWGSKAYVTDNFAVAPDGTTTAARIYNTGASDNVAQTVTVVAGTTYTWTFRAKNNGGTTASYRVFNLTGSADIIGVTSYFSQLSSTNWTTITVTFTAPAGCTQAIVYVSASNGPTSNILVWGAQLEAGAFATSYIPTVASTVTRSADVATINGSLFSQWYGQSEGTFVAEGSTFSNSSTGLVTASLPSNLDYMHIRRGAGAPSFRVQTTAGVQADFGTIASTGKTAAAYLINDFAVSSNGGAVSTDTLGAVPTVTSFQLGALYTAFFLNGHIRSIDYIPARAADFQLQALTL